MKARGDGASFLLKALTRFGNLGKMLRQNLDGDGAVEPHIAGAMHLAHAARAKRAGDFVRPEFCP